MWFCLSRFLLEESSIGRFGDMTGFGHDGGRVGGFAGGILPRND